jgi:hypothetical protein
MPRCPTSDRSKGISVLPPDDCFWPGRDLARRRAANAYSRPTPAFGERLVSGTKNPYSWKLG